MIMHNFFVSVLCFTQSVLKGSGVKMALFCIICLGHLEKLTFKAEVKERIQVDSEGHIEIRAGRVCARFLRLM